MTDLLRALVCCVGLVYPAYLSIVTRENPNAKERWFRYWCVFGAAYGASEVAQFLFGVAAVLCQVGDLCLAVLLLTPLLNATDVLYAGIFTSGADALKTQFEARRGILDDATRWYREQVSDLKDRCQ